MPKKKDNPSPPRRDYQSQDFSEEMRNSYRDYAMSVIIARALPDVRDGLKPVQRRILYASHELGLSPDKPHRKSARIVGDTMGKYHPHGDSSIYDALIHMSQDWLLELPLIDGHGNFGSIDGDSAAAMRYTEARLSPAAEIMLQGLSRGLVDFIPNFDESEKEPVILPAKLPNLLINGTTGIAVGMATNMPTHNAGEVIDGVIAVMKKPDMTVKELMKYIPGPDFPTGGIITNADDLPAIYETGEGKLRVRARAEIEKGDAGRTNIVITEIPYTASGSKTKLVEGLVAAQKAFDEIYDVRDESSKEGIRIVIEVKKGRDTENLLNGLYKKTGLEDTFSVNMLAVRDKQPITFNLKSLISEFINFQEEIYTREYNFLLDKAVARQEIVSGLISAVDVIDLIIEVLRGSDNVRQAKECLTLGRTTGIRFKTKKSEKEASQFNFTEAQADAILAMQLSRLIGLELLKLKEEEAELEKNIADYRRILGDKKELYVEIAKVLKEYRKKFATPRKTELDNAVIETYVEEVKVEDLLVLVDRFGYTKAVDPSAAAKAGEDSLQEFVHQVTVKNTDRLCVFTAEGNLYFVKADKIPKVRLRDKGTLIHNLIKLGKEEPILYVAFERVFEGMLFFSTKQGFVKLVSGIEFDTNRLQVAATKLGDGDALVDITVLNAMEILSNSVVVYTLTKKKQILAYPLHDVTEMKKTGRGVKGIQLAEGDQVIAAKAQMGTEPEVVLGDEVIPAKRFTLARRASKGKRYIKKS